MPSRGSTDLLRAARAFPTPPRAMTKLFFATCVSTAELLERKSATWSAQTLPAIGKTAKRIVKLMLTPQRHRNRR